MLEKPPSIGSTLPLYTTRGRQFAHLRIDYDLQVVFRHHPCARSRILRNDLHCRPPRFYSGQILEALRGIEKARRSGPRVPRPLVRRIAWKPSERRPQLPVAALAALAANIDLAISKVPHDELGQIAGGRKQPAHQPLSKCRCTKIWRNSASADRVRRSSWPRRQPARPGSAPGCAGARVPRPRAASWR
jgi:hypothetical protein